MKIKIKKLCYYYAHTKGALLVFVVFRFLSIKIC